jgi:hypothetical protein
MITVPPSMIITLLCAMAWRASMKVRILALASDVAELYFSFRWLLPRIACTLTPRLSVATRALAMGSGVRHRGVGEEHLLEGDEVSVVERLGHGDLRGRKRLG